MLADPNSLSGLGDGGAYLLMISDAAMTTFHLSFWTRDRKRGPTLPLEQMVHKLTGNSVSVYGLDDRGVIAVGKRADINVIDLERLDNTIPEMVFDLPRGGGPPRPARPRLSRYPGGRHRHRRHDRDTGARPGRLLRLGR